MGNFKVTVRKGNLELIIEIPKKEGSYGVQYTEGSTAFTSVLIVKDLVKEIKNLEKK